ncbi:MAG: methionyl-tRNA formyltransferase [Acidimicrobiia bacterium]
MRIAYFGTPADAVPPLRALVGAGHEVVAVVSQPDRRRGRGGRAEPSPVKAAAVELGLTVRTPDRARELVDELTAIAPDAGVVVAFGQLLPSTVLATARLGFVNLHFSLLPRWRGAAPVERAILAGDRETGVCVMALDEGLDTGPVYATVNTPIGPDESAGALRARLVALGTPLLVGVLADLAERVPRPQAGAATHAAKLTADDFRLDWARTGEELARVVRAGNPRPGAWTFLDGQRVKVLHAAVSGAVLDAPPGTVDPDGRVATGEGSLVLSEVQPAGKAAMDARAWLAGRRGAPTRFAP